MDMTTDPRTGQPIARSALVRRNAGDTYTQQTAGARGELYVPDPYGVGGGSRVPGGGSGGGTYTAGSGGSGGYTAAGSPAGNNIVTSPGGGGGNINLSRGSYEDQQAMLLRAKLANDAFGRVSGSTSGGASPTVQYGGADADAARAATFARAKEQAGMNAGAALKSLQDVMGSRGLRGSTIEGDLTNEAISGGRGDIANSITNQLNEELGQQQHVADTTYAGGITQRGQDMNAKQAMLSILAGLY